MEMNSMAPRKRKSSRSILEEGEEKPEIALNFQEIEAKIKETAEELKKAEGTEKNEQSKEDKSNKGEKLKQNIEKIKGKEGIIGYILRNSTSASIDLKDPTKIIDYAILSSSALEASEELSNTFKLGDVKHVIVEGNNAKFLSLAVDENKVSVFMEKNVDHTRICKELLS